MAKVEQKSAELLVAVAELVVAAEAVVAAAESYIGIGWDTSDESAPLVEAIERYREVAEGASDG